MTKTIHVRPAEAGDIARMAEIADATLFPGALLPDMIAPFFEGTTCHWHVATVSDDVAGFAYAAPEEMTDGTWNLRAIAVAEPARRLGLGHALLQSIEVALERQARLLIIDTTQVPDQQAGRALYQAMGYTQVAQIKDFWEDGADKVTYAKVLRSA